MGAHTMTLRLPISEAARRDYLARTGRVPRDHITIQLPLDDATPAERASWNDVFALPSRHRFWPDFGTLGLSFVPGPGEERRAIEEALTLLEQASAERAAQEAQ